MEQVNGIDIRQERLYPLRQFPRVLLQQRGIHRSYGTLLNWSGRGIQVGDKRVVLQCATVAGARHMSLEAFDRFLQQQQSDGWAADD